MNFVDFDSGVVDFEALGREEYEFRKAMFFKNFKNSERAKAAYEEAKTEYLKRVENGKKGGRPAKNTDDEPNGEISGAEAVKLLNSRRNSRCPSSRAEFHNFVYDENLHQGFAEEWFDIHEKREWKTKDGKQISNWKGALKRYCESREKDDG